MNLEHKRKRVKTLMQEGEVLLPEKVILALYGEDNANKRVGRVMLNERVQDQRGNFEIFQSGVLTPLCCLLLTAYRS